MNFKFRYLTPGYCGENKKQLTLNSAFYGELFSNQHLLKTKIIFPQRIVNHDFTSEVINTETINARAMLNGQIRFIINQLSNFDDHKEQEIVNWHHTALRYGLWNEIINTCRIELGDMNLAFELEFIRLIAQSQSALLSSQAVDPTGWEKLFSLIRDNYEIIPTMKLHIATAMIVTACRFQCRIQRNTLQAAQQDILTTISNMQRKTDAEVLRLSFCYRGMAMLPFLSNTLVQHYLDNAVLFGTKALALSSGLQHNVAKENLFTCNQTVTKWYLQNNQKKFALACLEQMIELDPYDSIGYAETGFLYLKYQDYKNAEQYFEKAVELGPPSVGMHLFYRGFSLKKLHRLVDAERCLLQAIKIDSTGVSSYLDLIDIYGSMNNNRKQKKIAVFVLKNRSLYSQLDKNEKERLVVLTKNDA